MRNKKLTATASAFTENYTDRTDMLVAADWFKAK